ncbi:MAG: XTP/dITP diphosphatase [Chloroflexota bacterium]|nr:XTP/dITP diphosphatase [Chloroflexota bacterium]
MHKLVIATHNQGKLLEYRQLLADLPLEVVSLDDLGITEDAPETGRTFAQNAQMKALAYAEMTGLATWADDSGLEVDALGGQPGVYSARYGGPGLSDSDRVRLLLQALHDLPSPQRTARFRCAVAIALPDGSLHTVEDSVEGVIAGAPRGGNGFGYDPVFLLPDRNLTMAELPPTIKNRISHRGKAAHAAKLLIAQIIDQMPSHKQD